MAVEGNRSFCDDSARVVLCTALLYGRVRGTTAKPSSLFTPHCSSPSVRRRHRYATQLAEM
jgi:hypothetical protein